MYLPTGIDGLKESPEARENEKIGLNINNSFLTVQANYTFTEVATRVWINLILKAEPDHDWLFERVTCAPWGFFSAIVTVCLCLHLFLTARIFLYPFDCKEMQLCPECK